MTEVPGFFWNVWFLKVCTLTQMLVDHTEETLKKNFEKHGFGENSNALVPF